jgi:hypothetical protein
VHAATQNKDHGLMGSWFLNIRDVMRLHKPTLEACNTENEHHRKLVELNVIEQCLNLYKTGIVQRQRLKTYNSRWHKFAMPRVHGLVFDPAVGLLNKLDVPQAAVQEHQDIYDLFASPKVGAGSCGGCGCRLRCTTVRCIMRMRCVVADDCGCVVRSTGRGQGRHQRCLLASDQMAQTPTRGREYAGHDAGDGDSEEE